MHLPRLIDKIRLHHAAKLSPDYEANLLHKGFDALWFEVTGVDPAVFAAVVKNSITDGEVAEWVRVNVKNSDAEKASHRDRMLLTGTVGDDVIARLKQRKSEANLSHRNDIKTFVDFIDADEGRS